MILSKVFTYYCKTCNCNFTINENNEVICPYCDERLNIVKHT